LQRDILNHLFLEARIFQFDPVIAERQCPELKKTFRVRSLFPALISSLVDQHRMNVNEDGASGVLNRPTNHACGGLREHKRRHGKIRKNPEDQVPLHLSPSSQDVVRDAGKGYQPPSQDGKTCWLSREKPVSLFDLAQFHTNVGSYRLRRLKHHVVHH
jgi:hypothetical protein